MAIEVIYVAIQTCIYTLILYSMIGFEWTVAKFFYFYYFIVLCFIYFTLYGMMLVALTPGHQVAAISMSFFLSFWNLFSGFLIPRPVCIHKLTSFNPISDLFLTLQKSIDIFHELLQQIPIWWRWYYWASPVAWTIYGLITSQVGDKDADLEVPGAGTVPLKTFLKDALGFDHDFLPAVVAAHVGWVLLFLFAFAYGIKFFNFQRR